MTGDERAVFTAESLLAGIKAEHEDHYSTPGGEVCHRCAAGRLGYDPSQSWPCLPYRLALGALERERRIVAALALHTDPDPFPTGCPICIDGDTPWEYPCATARALGVTQ